MSVTARIAIEHALTKFLYEDLIRQGYRLMLTSGDDPMEECEKTPTRNVDDLLDLSMNVDDITVLLFASDKADARCLGWVKLVYGNDGFDLVSDYSMAIEHALAETIKLSDRFADGRFQVVPVDGYCTPVQALDSVKASPGFQYREWSWSCVGGRFFPVRNSERPADPIPSDRDGDGFAPADGEVTR